MSEPRILIDPYFEWAQNEGIPVNEGFGFDLLHMDVKPWSRLGVNGAIALVAGRGDFLDTYVLEIPGGGSTEPQRHLFEEVIYVLDGHGSTTIHGPGDSHHSFEWGPKSLFAIPLNASYRHFNTSGSKAVRLASVTNLPMVMKMFRNHEFIFQNSFEFAERIGDPKFFEGEGDFIPVRPGRNMWETNFVPDLSVFELRQWKERGAGGSSMMFAMADETMHVHCSEMPVGTYKKAHRHGADFHIFPVSGNGYSLFWYEGDADFVRFDWKHGSLYAPADLQFHQHFNTSREPARYLAIAFGGLRYPFSEDKRKQYLQMDISLKDGGRQVEYEDQDPRIHRLYIEALREIGIEPNMSEIFAPQE